MTRLELWSGLVAAITTFACGICVAQSQSHAEKRAEWPYAAKYDEPTAAGMVYHVRYEDTHIRLVEVAAFPGVRTLMHGDPYPAVVAMDAPLPKLESVLMNPSSPLNGQRSQQAPPPQGLLYPIGRTEAPMAPHEFTNVDTFPLHYFRIEFKRIVGDDIATHWKMWYPWLLTPIKPVANVNPRDPELGAVVSKDYPFAAATESYIAAPNNHYIRYQDDHIFFLEVCARPNERENIHGHAFPSVFAFDIGPSPMESGPMPQNVAKEAIGEAVPDAQNVPGVGHAGAGGDWQLDPKGMNGWEGAGMCAAPTGMKWPSCLTMGPQWPHAGANPRSGGGCFYRINYKRIDGDGIKTHWKEWYPWMAHLAVQYQHSKTSSSGN